jgi:hypothetical protein
MILGLITVNLRRFGVTTWAAGRGSATPTTSTFKGSWQPLNGREIAMLAEGERASDHAKIFTTTLLRTADQHGKTAADNVNRDGSTWFKVLKVGPYFSNAPIPHYRVEVVRLREAA